VAAAINGGLGRDDAELLQFHGNRRAATIRVAIGARLLGGDRIEGLLKSGRDRDPGRETIRKRIVSRRDARQFISV
jgi:hypothetical protein